MPIDTTAAEQAIADANSARDDFLSRASELFDAPSPGVNRMADALEGATPAKPKAAPAPAKAKSTAVDPAKPLQIPGPPTADPPPASPTPDGDPAASASPQGTTPSEDDIPAEDAFDKGPNRPKTDDWRRLHAAKKAIVQQLTEARKEVETLKARTAGVDRDGVLPPEIQERIKSVETERDTLLRKLEAVAVEKSPRFEQHFKPRTEAALLQAKQAVGPEKAAAITELLNQPESVYRDKQIEAMLGEMEPNSLRAQKLVGAVAEMDRISAERAALSQQGSELYKQWQAEEQAALRRQSEERERQVGAEFDAELSAWKGVEYLDDSGVALAREVYSGNNKSLRDIARAAMWTAVGPKAAAVAMKLQQELAAANAKLARYENAEPGNSNNAGSAPSADDDIPEGTSFADAVALAVRKAGLPIR